MLLLTATLYDKFRDHMKKARTPDEFYTYLRNLGRFRDPDLAVRTAQLFLTPEVKGQDVYQILGVVGNRHTQKVGWDFVKSHFTERGTSLALNWAPDLPASRTISATKTPAVQSQRVPQHKMTPAVTP